MPHLVGIPNLEAYSAIVAQDEVAVATIEFSPRLVVIQVTDASEERWVDSLDMG